MVCASLPAQYSAALILPSGLLPSISMFLAYAGQLALVDTLRAEGLEVLLKSYLALCTISRRAGLLIDSRLVFLR